MSGLGTSSQSQQTSQQTQPWAPAQPALQGILSGIQGQLGNYTPNAAENTALGQLAQNANSQPNYGSQIGNLASGYLGGDPTGLLNPALQQYQQQLSPYANGQNLNPMTAPGMQGVLQTIQSDVGNSVNQQFAGAGRDLSGLNQQSLARGISQGEAQPLLAQYNQNVQNQLGAAGSLYGAAGQTAGQIMGSQNAGVNLASAQPAFQNANAMAQLNAQAAARGLPLNNLGALENLTVPIAGLGSQSQGTSQGTATMSPFSMLTGGLYGGSNSALSGAAGLGQGILSGLGAALPFF